MFVRFTLLCTMGQMGDGDYRFPLVQRTDPIEKGAFGVGVSPRVLIAVRANMWCVAFYMPGLRDGSICRG